MTRSALRLSLLAGLGGLLYGYDLGIIGAALLYLDKCIRLSEAQVGLLASAVMIGALASSVVGGGTADLLGRKKALLLSALLFIASVGLIVTSSGFWQLFCGRTLQGLSAGMIAVVVPVYLTECARADIRGVTATMFQLCITIGIALAMFAGAWFQGGVEQVMTAANASPDTVLAAQDHAWRMMFVSSGYPALAFILVAILISESPRWLFRHQRRDQALAVLAQDRPLDQAKAEVAQMEQLAHAHGPARSDSIFQRRYLLPLVLAITLLAINQATGIGAVFTFPVIMLNQAGLSEQAAAQTSVWLAITNVLVTVLGVLLIDRWGRKVLLKIGTTVIMLALAVGIATYWRVESGMTDVTERLQRAVNGTSLTLPFSQLTTTTEAPAQVSILYAYDGHQQPLQLIRSDVSAGTVSLSAPAGIPSTATLEILRAKVSLAPSPQTGSVIFACLILYIAGFAFGPGVCLWVMSSEMLPTRIRSLGMGLGVLGNAGVTVLTTALFLPTVGNFGYAAMWAVWFLCTLAYFLFAAFILPETKGRSLEEIEAHFSRSTPTPRNAP